MKYIRILALAAVAAMALVAATSASATVLCEETPTGTNPATCPPAATYGPGTLIEATSVNATLTTSTGFPNVKCEHSEATAETANTGGAAETVTGSVTGLVFQGCETESFAPTPCTVTAENLPYRAELHWTAGTHNGTLTVSSGGLGNPRASVICMNIIECKFFKTLFDLPITGGNPAQVTAFQVSLSMESVGLCPNSASWDASYKATSPANIWVAKEE